MQQTRALLELRFPNSISTIVIEYICSKERDWRSIAGAGEYETVLGVPPECADPCLYGAACGGYPELVELAVRRGASDFDFALSRACAYGHLDIAEYLIRAGATSFINGLFNACKNKHPALVQLMIYHGAEKCNNCGVPVNSHQ